MFSNNVHCSYRKCSLCCFRIHFIYLFSTDFPLFSLSLLLFSYFFRYFLHNKPFISALYINFLPFLAKIEFILHSFIHHEQEKQGWSLPSSHGKQNY